MPVAAQLASPYVAGQWTGFLLAQVIVAVLVGGLGLVTMASNLDRVMATPGLVARGAAPLVSVLAMLLAGLVALIPDQASPELGAELLVLGLVFWGLLVLFLERARRLAPTANLWFWSLQAVGQISAAAYFVAGVTLLISSGGGLDWVVVGAVAALLFAPVTFWLLLVEVSR